MTNIDQGNSHLSPAPIGMTVKAKIERGDSYAAPEIFDVEITVLNTTRGSEALKLMKEQAISDVSILTGFEVLLTRIRFSHVPRGRGFVNEPFKLTGDQFVAVSPDGKTHYQLPIVEQQPQPQLIGKLLSPGESHEGWILLQVPQDENNPLLIFNREYVEGVYGIWGYIWFQLYS